MHVCKHHRVPLAALSAAAIWTAVWAGFIFGHGIISDNNLRAQLDSEGCDVDYCCYYDAVFDGEHECVAEEYTGHIDDYYGYCRDLAGDRGESGMYFNSLEECEHMLNSDYGSGGNPECNDGMDNDYDGQIDYPYDDECDSPTDDSELYGPDSGTPDYGQSPFGDNDDDDDDDNDDDNDDDDSSRDGSDGSRGNDDDDDDDDNDDDNDDDDSSRDGSDGSRGNDDDDDDDDNDDNDDDNDADNRDTDADDRDDEDDRDSDADDRDDEDDADHRDTDGDDRNDDEDDADDEDGDGVVRSRDGTSADQFEGCSDDQGVFQFDPTKCRQIVDTRQTGIDVGLRQPPREDKPKQRPESLGLTELPVLTPEQEVVVEEKMATRFLEDSIELEKQARLLTLVTKAIDRITALQASQTFSADGQRYLHESVEWLQERADVLEVGGLSVREQQMTASGVQEITQQVQALIDHETVATVEINDVVEKTQAFLEKLSGVFLVLAREGIEVEPDAYDAYHQATRIFLEVRNECNANESDCAALADVFTALDSLRAPLQDAVAESSDDVQAEINTIFAE